MLKNKTASDSISHQMYALYSSIFHMFKKKKDQNIVQVGTTHDSPPAGPGLPVLRFHETTELKPTKFNKPNFTIFFFHMKCSDH